MGYPLLDLTNKTAVVIGGTSGIGLALTKELAQAGANNLALEARDGRPRSRRSAGPRLRRRLFALARRRARGRARPSPRGGGL